jgi:hypothetical protein
MAHLTIVIIAIMHTLPMFDAIECIEKQAIKVNMSKYAFSHSKLRLAQHAKRRMGRYK